MARSGLKSVQLTYLYSVAAGEKDNVSSSACTLSSVHLPTICYPLVDIVTFRVWRVLSFGLGFRQPSPCLGYGRETRFHCAPDDVDSHCPMGLSAAVQNLQRFQTVALGCCSL